MNTINDKLQETPKVGEKPKKIVDRSAAYPSSTIEDSIEFSKSVARNFPKEGTTITRDDIAAVLKTTPPSIQRDVATCAQYGLFSKQKEGYQISPILKALNNPKGEKDRRKNVLECFNAPKLYKDLIAKFDGHAIPAELHYHLVRDHEISEKAAPEAARIFILNATYSGVLNESGVLNFEEVRKILSDDNFQLAEVITNEEQPIVTNNTNRVLELPQKPLDTTINGNSEKVEIRLTEKKYAYLSYPENITKKDIDILRKELDIIEFRITE